jgi:hypothetical protein
MAWHPLATVALDVDTDIAPARAQAITDALCRRIVALLVNREGRVEPLASGCLYWSEGHLVLVTCLHAFDGGVALGDVFLPMGASGRLVQLRSLNARFIEHPHHDVAAIGLCPRKARDALQRHWFPVPLSLERVHRSTTSRLVIAGYPYAQMRRVEGTVYARPLVFFARSLGNAGGGWHASYGRTARRLDGVVIHAPELDGVSGATVWAIDQESDDVECVLLPAGVQCAFRHDRYVRGESIAAAHDMVARLVAQ